MNLTPLHSIPDCAEGGQLAESRGRDGGRSQSISVADIMVDVDLCSDVSPIARMTCPPKAHPREMLVFGSIVPAPFFVPVGVFVNRQP